MTTDFAKKETKYTLHNHYCDDMQELLIKSIRWINLHINLVNHQNNMITPDLAGTVVEKRKGREQRIGQDK